MGSVWGGGGGGEGVQAKGCFEFRREPLPFLTPLAAAVSWTMLAMTDGVQKGLMPAFSALIIRRSMWASS